MKKKRKRKNKEVVNFSPCLKYFRHLNSVLIAPIYFSPFPESVPTTAKLRTCPSSRSLINNSKFLHWTTSVITIIIAISQIPKQIRTPIRISQMWRNKTVSIFRRITNLPHSVRRIWTTFCWTWKITTELLMRLLLGKKKEKKRGKKKSL